MSSGILHRIETGWAELIRNASAGTLSISILISGFQNQIAEQTLLHPLFDFQVDLDSDCDLENRHNVEFCDYNSWILQIKLEN